MDDSTGLSHHWNRWYDPQLGKWISEDPKGFAAWDTNLNRYVENNALNFIDSTGTDKRKVGEYAVQGKGHHIIPVEIWDKYGFHPAVYPLLDSLTIETPIGHNPTAHGAATGYTGFMQSELQEKLSEHLKNNPTKQLSIAEQQAFLLDFVDDVKKGNVNRTFIFEFNQRVGQGPKVLDAWNKGLDRKNFPPRPDKLPNEKILGVREIPKGMEETLAMRLGAPSTRGLLGLGASKVTKRFLPFLSAWIAYNNALANGNNTVGAATVGVMEAVNPLPIGYDEWTAAGDAYSNAVDWALENNVHGPGGQIPVDKEGFPIKLNSHSPGQSK
jgi:RHS repeat-associated protein